jgi:hypothetical protein
MRYPVELLISTILIVPSAMFSQTEKTPTISIPVLEQQPIVTVQPIYPVAAQKAHIKGLVVLDIVIGQDGAVETAVPIKGPKELRQAAVDAAMQCKWKPFLLNEKPFRVQTPLFFNFVLPADPNPYPNELPGYRFFRQAKWNSLRPLISTMADTRRVLGKPDEAVDVAQYTQSYPGDDAAKEPVWTYHVNQNWDRLVYFTRYCFHPLPKKVPGDRLCSIDLIPRNRITMNLPLPNEFNKQHVDAVDAAWDEYSDGTGLRYEIYTSKPQYGVKQIGDLNRISYGPLMQIISTEAHKQP